MRSSFDQNPRPMSEEGSRRESRPHFNITHFWDLRPIIQLSVPWCGCSWIWQEWYSIGQEAKSILKFHGFGNFSSPALQFKFGQPHIPTEMQWLRGLHVWCFSVLSRIGWTSFPILRMFFCCSDDRHRRGSEHRHVSSHNPHHPDGRLPHHEALAQERPAHREWVLSPAAVDLNNTHNVPFYAKVDVNDNANVAFPHRLLDVVNSVTSKLCSAQCWHWHGNQTHSVVGAGITVLGVVCVWMCTQRPTLTQRPQCIMVFTGPYFDPLQWSWIRLKSWGTEPFWLCQILCELWSRGGGVWHQGGTSIALLYTLGFLLVYHVMITKRPFRGLSVFPCFPPGGVQERKSGGSSSIYSHESETPFIKRSVSQDTDLPQQVNGGPRYHRSGSRSTDKPQSRIICTYTRFRATFNAFFSRINCLSKSAIGPTPIPVSALRIDCECLNV